MFDAFDEVGYNPRTCCGRYGSGVRDGRITVFMPWITGRCRRAERNQSPL